MVTFFSLCHSYCIFLRLYFGLCSVNFVSVCHAVDRPEFGSDQRQSGEQVSKSNKVEIKDKGKVKSRVGGVDCVSIYELLIIVDTVAITLESTFHEQLPLKMFESVFLWQQITKIVIIQQR